jgi:hypothetical protein
VTVRQAAVAVVGGYRFDDEVVFVTWVEWHYCSGCGFLHEGADGLTVGWNYQRCLLPLGGVAAQPPAGVVAAVGEDGACAGLVCCALFVGLHSVILEWGEQDVVYLHAVVAAAVPDSDSPDRPVTEP